MELPGCFSTHASLGQRRIASVKSTSPVFASLRSAAMPSLVCKTRLKNWYICQFPRVEARFKVGPSLPRPESLYTEGFPCRSICSHLFHSPALRRPLRGRRMRSEEHTSELQSLRHLVCRL